MRHTPEEVTQAILECSNVVRYHHNKLANQVQKPLFLFLDFTLVEVERGYHPVVHLRYRREDIVCQKCGSTAQQDIDRWKHFSVDYHLGYNHDVTAHCLLCNWLFKRYHTMVMDRLGGIRCRIQLTNNADPETSSVINWYVWPSWERDRRVRQFQTKSSSSFM